MKNSNYTIAGIHKMLTVTEVGELLHKSAWSVQRLARLNKIPGARRVGKGWLFCRGEVQRFVEGL